MIGMVGVDALERLRAGESDGAGADSEMHAKVRFSRADIKFPGEASLAMVHSQPQGGGRLPVLEELVPKLEMVGGELVPESGVVRGMESRAAGGAAGADVT